MQPAHATATFSIQFIHCEQQQKGCSLALCRSRRSRSQAQPIARLCARQPRQGMQHAPHAHSAHAGAARPGDRAAAAAARPSAVERCLEALEVQGSRIKAAQGEGASCADFLGGLSARLTRNNGSEVDAKVHLRCTAAWQVRSAVAANAQQRTATHTTWRGTH